MYRNKSDSMSGKVVTTNLLGFLILSSILVSSTIAAPMTNVDSSDQDTSGLRFKRSLVDIENPREVLRVLDTLAQAILDSQVQGVMYGGAEKRGIDLGMNRGFSGRQAARHLVGLASAQFAGGPGRK